MTVANDRCVVVASDDVDKANIFGNYFSGVYTLKENLRSFSLEVRQSYVRTLFYLSSIASWLSARKQYLINRIT